MKRALIYLHIAVFLGGLTGVLGRLITLNESLLVWYRLLITVVTLCALGLLRGSFPRIAVKNLVRVFGVGGIVAFHWVCFYGSIKYSNVSIALVSFSTLGFFSAVLEPVIFNRRVSLAELLLGMVAVAGVYYIFHFDTRYTTGIAFGLVSAISAALFTVLNKKLLQHNDARTVTLYELMGGFIILTCILPVYLRHFNLHLTWPSAHDWWWLLVLSWLCTVLAFYLSMSALKTTSPFTVNLSYNLEPVYGIILAFVIYKENKELHPSFYVGLFCIIAAVCLQMLRVYRSRIKT